VIRENPASRGTETSAEVLVGPPLGAGGWSETFAIMIKKKNFFFT
jgi:hypothetical protein